MPADTGISSACDKEGVVPADMRTKSGMFEFRKVLFDFHYTWINFKSDLCKHRHYCLAVCILQIMLMP